MINEGSSSDELWPDQWTAVTVDGKRSAQFEHTLLIVDGGVEILTSRIGAPRDAMPSWEMVMAGLSAPLALPEEGGATSVSASSTLAGVVCTAADSTGGAASTAVAPASASGATDSL